MQNVDEQQLLKVEAKQLGHLSDKRIICGWVAGVISLACLFISHRRDEPAPRSIVIVLMGFYLLLQFAEI